jgi:hypothetical protein
LKSGMAPPSHSKRELAIYFLPHRGSLRQNAARPQALFQAGLKPLKFHDRVLGVLRPILNRHRLCALPQHLLTGETYAQSEPDIVRYWEIIADNLKRAGWSLGYVSAVDFEGRTIWIADAHRGDGKRFVVRADEKLNGFSGTRICDLRLRRIASTSWRDSSETPRI